MTNQPSIDRPWDPPKQPKQKQPWFNQTKWIVAGVIGAFALFIVGLMVFGWLTNGSKSSVAKAKSSLSVTEQDFVRVLGLKPDGFTQEQAITEGRQVCDIFEAGGVGTNAVSRLLDLGMTQDEAVRVVFAATASFCPEYELDAQR